MLISLLLIATATAGGLPVTYLVDEDAPLMWRLAAGNIIGCAILGTVAFILALAFGLTVVTVVAASAMALLPLLMLRNPVRRKKFYDDWSRAKSRTQGSSGKKFLRFAYYTFFFLLFFFFFDRAMLESASGIYTGGSQNLGDLPFHLGAIFSFTEINNFPPVNPSFAGARFSYPFIADLLTACSVKLGASARDALFVQNLAWAFSLLVILERFVLKLTTDKLASRIAPALLFFSGGLGFIWFLSDFWSQGKGFFDFINALPKDYTIGDQFRWGNSMVVLFMTQRSLLLGMPLTLLVLGYLWDRFTEQVDAAPRVSPSPLLLIAPHLRVALTGLLAGMLPLIHLHSLAVLFVFGVFLVILRPERWMTWTAFAVGVAVIAVPELVWSVTGSASETAKFFEWHFGWDKGDKNFIWFWFINTGLVIPVLLAGLYLTAFQPAPVTTPSQGRKGVKKKKVTTESVEANSPFTTHHSPLLWFYVPFAFLFLVSNAAKLAPWQWDNIKVLIYWFVGSLPFIALAISWAWRRGNGAWKAAAAVCVIVLIASGVLDVWRTASGQVNYKVFDKDAVEVASQIRTRTPANALFLNAPTFNTAVVLSGRQSLMRYPGHLGSHGIDYAQRESDVKQIYEGGPGAPALMEMYGIQYVLVSPEERSKGAVNDQFFSRYPTAAESGQYRVYKIK